MRTLVIAAVCGVVLTPALFLAAFLFLVSQEDYTPAPGTLTYYLGISSLVRGAPLAGAAGPPHYYGTVGDGNKQARSEVAYELPPENLNQAMAAINAYLLQNGQHERPLEAADQAAVRAFYGDLFRYAEYTSPQGGLVVVMVQSLMEDSRIYRISVSEYH